MERLDKLLANTGRWSRREARELVRQGRVTVDGAAAAAPEEKYEAGACFAVDGEIISGEKRAYVMLHKPAGLLSATEDPRRPTVMELLPEHLRRMGLFPVGRLDKDTEGLLLLTNDGELAQRLTHPSCEVDKVYLARVTGNPSNDALDRLRRGVYMEGDERRTYPAQVRVVRDESLFSDILVTIHEGRNRQVRRMFDSVGHKVLLLRRVRFGPLELGDLRRGEWRELSAEEIARLKAL